MATITLVFSDANGGKEPLRVSVSRKNLIERCQVLADMVSDTALGPGGTVPLSDTVSYTVATLFATAINNNALPTIMGAHDLFKNDTPHATRLVHWNVAALAFKYGYNVLLGFYIWAFSRALGEFGPEWFVVSVPSRTRTAVKTKRGRDGDEAYVEDGGGKSNERDQKRGRFKFPLPFTSSAASCAVCDKLATGTCTLCKNINTCSKTCLDAVHAGECFSFYVVPETSTATDTDLGVTVDLRSESEIDSRLSAVMSYMAPYMQSPHLTVSLQSLGDGMVSFPNDLFVDQVWKSLVEFLMRNSADANYRTLFVIRATIVKMHRAGRRDYSELGMELARVVVETDAMDALLTWDFAEVVAVTCPLHIIAAIFGAHARTKYGMAFPYKMYLMLAARYGRVDIIKYIFDEAGATLQRDAVSDAMVAAAIANEDSAIKLIIELTPGGAGKLQNDVARSFAEAANRGSLAVVDTLEPLVSNSTYMRIVYPEALSSATSNGHSSVVKKLLDTYPTDMELNSYPLLQIAIVHDHPEAFRVLVNHPRINLLSVGTSILKLTQQSDNDEMEKIFKKAYVARSRARA